ncbi:MAG: hypothetical protein RLZ44_524 [Pseudomonadota bacterium]
MIEELGRVVEVRDGAAAVASSGAAACGGCASQGGCGTASLARFFQRRQRVLWVRNAVSANPGDQVLVGLDEGALLRAAWVAYALPLAGLLLGGMLGEALASATTKELSALLFCLLGLITGLALARRLSWRLARQPRYQAEILRVVTPGQGELRCEPGTPVSYTNTLEK